MRELQRHRHLPDANRLSTLAAAILLAYALAHLIEIPASELDLQLPGIYISIPLSIQALAAVLIAALTAAGADWLLRSHPYLGRHNTLEHWLLPALTAGVISLPLFQLPLSLVWWAGFAFGGLLLVLVLVAEYIVVDAQDVRHAPAGIGLTAVSFALFLVLATGLRYAGLRLFLILPAISLAAWLVSLRALRLRSPGQWSSLPAAVMALLITQIAAGLHYWPLTPVAFGLALLGPLYSLTSLIGSLADGEPLRQAVVEPLALLLLIWGAAAWMQ